MNAAFRRSARLRPFGIGDTFLRFDLSGGFMVGTRNQ
jgi:hypothetical protein